MWHWRENDGGRQPRRSAVSLPRNLAATGLVALAVFSAAPADHADAASAAAGRLVYRQSCVACHGVAGNGAMPGVPDFRRSGGVLSQPDDVLFDRIKHGYRSPGAPLAMPAKGGNSALTDDDIRDVLAYLRETFGPTSGGTGATQPPANGNPSGNTPGGMGSGGTGRGMMGGGMMQRRGSMMGR